MNCQKIYLQFDYTSGSSFTGDVAIDLIEVSSCISCTAADPSLLSVSSVTTDTVNLNWLGSSNHNSWLVYLVPSGSSVSNTIPFSPNFHSFSFSIWLIRFFKIRATQR